MGDIEDNFSLLLSTNILPMTIMNYFEFLLQNILCATDCMMLIMRLLFFLGGGGGYFH